jgi:hypothetical protein
MNKKGVSEHNWFHFKEENSSMKKHPNSRKPVAQAHNSSYSGGRDQEVHSSKAAWANSL